MSVDSEEQERPEDKLRMLPLLSPPADVTRRIALGPPSAMAGALPVGPRVVLFLTVLVYLGWAFRTASLLSQ